MDSDKSRAPWPLPVSDAIDAGVSAGRLEQIRPALQKYIDQGKAPGFVVLVARHGKIVYYDSLGFMDLESRKPVKTDTIFRMWSNSKPIAGVATMICVEDGLLSLDDPVSKFIPEFKNTRVRIDELEWISQKGFPPPPGLMPTVPSNREITLRDCLRNTTGLAQANTATIQYLNEFHEIIEESGLIAPPTKQPDNIRKMMAAMAKLPLAAQPGTRFAYQVGYPVIGLAIETATGKSPEEFYKERIFGPLGMKDSSFYLPKENLDRFSTAYNPVKKGDNWKLAVQERPEESERFTGPRTYFEAGGGRGGICTTAGDYARFAQMLLNGGELDGKRILSRKSVGLMTSSHTGDVCVTIPGPPGYGFGLGVGVYLGGDVSTLRSPGTYGWTGALGTSYFADPKEDLIGIIFTQVFMHKTIPGNLYQEEFERIVYQALVS
jgi:CubicO group peptidase (beta-lactamase class C family)